MGAGRWILLGTRRTMAVTALAVSLSVGSWGAADPAGALGASVQAMKSAQATKSVDACTAVPDSGPTFDFTQPCLTHDTCYIEQPDGSTARDRKRCDEAFRQAMMASCGDRYPERAQSLRRRACKAVALVYYLGVRALGGLAWDQEEPSSIV